MSYQFHRIYFLILSSQLIGLVHAEPSPSPNFCAQLAEASYARCIGLRGQEDRAACHAVACQEVVEANCFEGLEEDEAMLYCYGDYYPNEIIHPFYSPPQIRPGRYPSMPGKPFWPRDPSADPLPPDDIWITQDLENQ